MSLASAPAPGSSPPVRGAPLLITAELPPDVHAWADALRRTHYPLERNRLAAHVTMFHALPPSAEGEVRRLLAECARRDPPEAIIDGLMDLGRGTAFTVDSPGMAALHGKLAESLHGVIQQRDARPLRLHVTVQNKVSPAVARALQAELTRGFVPRRFRFRGLALSQWRGELWQMAQLYPFRGQG